MIARLNFLQQNEVGRARQSARGQLSCEAVDPASLNGKAPALARLSEEKCPERRTSA